MDDYISRQAVKDWIKRWEGYLDQDMIARMQYGVDHIPSVQPLKGKWAGVDGLYGCGIYICDQCGKFAMMKTDYCPNCGARMDLRGEQDE